MEIATAKAKATLGQGYNTHTQKHTLTNTQPLNLTLNLAT